MLYTKSKGHYFAWVREVLRERKLTYALVSRVEVKRNKKKSLFKDGGTNTKCKGEVERKKDKELKFFKMIKILGGEGEKT